MKNKTKSINSSIVSKVALMLFVMMLSVTALVACSQKSEVELMSAPDIGALSRNIIIYRNETLTNFVKLSDSAIQNKPYNSTLIVYMKVAYKTQGSSTFDHLAPINTDRQVASYVVNDTENRVDVALYGSYMNEYINEVNKTMNKSLAGTV